MLESKLVALACGVKERREQMAPAIAELGRRARPTFCGTRWSAASSPRWPARRLRELGALPPSLDERVQERLHGNRMRSVFYAWTASRSLDALEEAGIPALPLKGFALAEDVHADPGLRSYGDIDVLVPAHELHRAGEVLRPFGYVPIEEHPSQRPDLHTVLIDRSGKLPPVEVHWRVHWFEEAFSEQMLARSHRHDGGRRRAQPTDELAALLLFFARDGFLGLRLAADLAAWWDTCGPDLPPQALDRARRRASRARARVVDRAARGGARGGTARGADHVARRRTAPPASRGPPGQLGGDRSARPALGRREPGQPAALAQLSTSPRSRAARLPRPRRRSTTSTASGSTTTCFARRGGSPTRRRCSPATASA